MPGRTTTAVWMQTAVFGPQKTAVCIQTAEKEGLADHAGDGAQAGRAFVFEVVRWGGFVGAVEGA